MHRNHKSTKYKDGSSKVVNVNKPLNAVENCSSSCSCSSHSSPNTSNCSCCCSCTTLSCSSDSDERFARYYQLSSDEAELRGIDFPAESKKQRKDMVKFLLHTMVMWDDIWRTRDLESSSDDDDENVDDKSKKSVGIEQRRGKGKKSVRYVTESESSAYDSDSSDDGNVNPDNNVQFSSIKNSNLTTPGGDLSKMMSKTENDDEQLAGRRLKRALDMKEDTGQQFFSGKWYGQPLEELDPFINDDTFCVLSWRSGPCVVYRYFKGDTVGLFPPDHPVRVFAFRVVTHRYFGALIVLTVFANCVTLALERFDYDEFGMQIESDSDMVYEILELVYLSIYTVEMTLKIIAKGFLFQKLAYLHSGWNVLDFIVVITSFITLAYQLVTGYSFHGTNLEFLRVFRVLRAVKTISILPSLRKIVNSLIHSSTQLLEVMFLTIFVITMLSLFGMEFFGGRFLQKCVRIRGVTNEDDMDPEFREITQGLSSYMTDRLYGMWIENPHNWLYRDIPDSEPAPCGNGTTARACPAGYVCLEVGNSENPNDGWISFDTFQLAALQTLQVMTLDYWERIYEIALSTVGREAIFFFALVIFFGGYYLLNLVLAVVALSYDKEVSSLDVNYTKLPIPKRLKLTRQLSTFKFEHLNQQRLRLFEGFRKRPARERDELLIRMVKADEFSHPVMKYRFETSNQFTPAVYNLLSNMGRYAYVNKSEAEFRQLALLNSHRQPVPEHGCYDEFQLFDRGSDVELENEDDMSCLKLTNGNVCNSNLPGFDQTFVVQNMAKFVTRPVKAPEFTLFPEESKTASLKVWLNIWANVTRPLVEDWRWKNLMTFCIFVNTVISCLEHYGQPDWLDYLIYLSNDVFTYIFCVELIVKGLAYQQSFFEYGWNKFDLFVVISSILDTVLQNTMGYKGLRALKLLRILKLAQAWNTLKIMLNILISAMTDMANLVLILFIAIYIFAVFGMQFIGNGYDPKSFKADFYPANYPRWAWQTFAHAFLMVFRVVCGEWVELISECMSAYKPRDEEYKCFLTFIPTLIFGNFIMLNLFLALLLHIFDAADLNAPEDSIKADRRSREQTGFRSCVRNLWTRIKSRFSKQKSTRGKSRRPANSKLSSKSNKVYPEDFETMMSDESESMSQESLTDDSLSIIESAKSNVENSSEAVHQSRSSVDSTSIVVHFDETLELNESPKSLLSLPSKPMRITPVGPQAKWEFYKVVMVYRDMMMQHGDEDEMEENVQKKNFRYRMLSNPYRLRPESEAKTRFRRAVYRIIMQIRKRHAEEAINLYVKSMTKKMMNACLTAAATKLDSHFSMVGVTPDAPHEEFKLPPCFPEWWYSKPACSYIPFNCKHVPCLDKSRWLAYRIAHHSYFEWSILVLIVASSISLCFEDIYLDDNPTLKEFLFYAAIFSTAVFFLEFIIKVFADGLYTYFTNPWSLLDFILVVIGIASVTADIMVRLGNSNSTFNHLNSLKVLRTLKALRPLRAISRWHGMKIVVNSLLQAIPAIFNVFCVCLVFWLVFAIMGVQFFKGRLYKCVNEIGETLDSAVAPNKQVCCQKANAFNFAWINTFPNFDSVPEAYIALLYLATFEGWIEVIRSGTDARDIDQQPVRDYDMFAHVYFILFCLFGGFLTTNLFIGVIIDNFNMLKKKFEGNLYEALMTPNQFKYYWSIKKLGSKLPRRVLPKPRNPVRLAFFEISMSQRGEFMMFGIIVANMILMCFDSYGHGVIVDSVLESLGAFFIFIYTLEAIVKIIGLGSYYFKSAWNIFDLTILFVSIADYVIGDLLSRSFPIPPSMVRLCRILRVGRVMRLMKTAKGIRRLIFALLVSIPALFNVGALLVLVIFIYSILGMSLFGRIGYGGAFDEIINFETFPNAFLLLFRLITSAGWNDILESLTSTETYCGDPDEDDCGGPDQPECTHWVVSLVYIVSYLIITNFVIVNMYIAIILENYHQATQQDELDVTADDIDIFMDKWAIFDGKATQYMELQYLSPFLSSLEPPFMIMKFPNQIAITALDIPIYEGHVVHVLDVMRKLIVFIIGQAETKQMEEIQLIINDRFAEQFRHKTVLPLVSTTRIWKIQYKATITIQRFWRGIRRRRRDSVTSQKWYPVNTQDHGAKGHDRRQKYPKTVDVEDASDEKAQSTHRMSVFSDPQFNKSHSE